MILQGAYDLLKLILGALLVLLPSYTPPPGIGMSALSAANFILPLSELGLVFSALGAYVVASLAYTLIMRIIKFIRGAG